MIAVPDDFAAATVRREGAAGQAWIDSLPALADELLQRWSLVPDGPVMHGSVGIVLPVRPSAVVKVAFPHPGNVHEPDAFAAWNGRGAVRIYRRDDSRFAMLLERADRGTLADVADHDHAVAVLGQLSQRLAVAAPAGLPRLRDQIDQWSSEILASGHPLPQRVLDAVIAGVRELDHPDTLVHGDLYDANVLAGDREPWLAIDPKGCVGDPAYDAFTVLHSPRLLFTTDHMRWLHLYCEAAGIDRERARRWTLLRAVRSALWDRRHGGPDWLVRATERLVEALA